MKIGACVVATRSAALLLVGAVSACSGSDGGNASDAVKSQQQALCTGIGQACTMPDGCSGTWVCTGGFRECAYNNTGSRACSTCPGGIQACSDTGPYGPCQWTSPHACTNTCGSGTQTCSDGVLSACNVAPSTRACNCNTGTQTCTNNSWSACSGSPTQSCGNSATGCGGTRTCTNETWGPCTCAVGSATSSCHTSSGDACGTLGSGTCAGDCTLQGACTVAERCNNCDDNGNGLIDEGQTCSPCGL